jgi:hypothetical protein
MLAGQQCSLASPMLGYVVAQHESESHAGVFTKQGEKERGLFVQRQQRCAELGRVNVLTLLRKADL